MALINKNNINRIDRKGNKIHSEVAGSYSVFINEDGKQFLQIDTYGSSDRKIQAKVSQSLQFDRETGEFLLNLLRNNEILAINKTNEIDKIDGFQNLGNIGNVVKRIENYMKSKSFIYSHAALSNFYLSLKTKPFVILAGTSGTGKSKLVRLFAEAIGATKDNGRFNMVSVKPDWNDSTELLGYKNINEEFVPGRLTKIILEASKAENKDKPYFICLDEMNLARVEYYLSDYLSLIESREVSESGEIITDKLFSMDYLGKDNPYSNLCIPENIYIIGTVNMDDTTFAFSRKVLDRANTIEFSEVNLQSLDFSDDDIQCTVLKNNFLKTSFLTIKDAVRYDKNYVTEINNKIIAINDILKMGNKHFGYRVRDEIVFYMLENKRAELLSEYNAFDYQIMQKVLPIITGSEYIVKEILIKLFNFCSPSGEIADGMDYLESAGKFKDNALYIESADKIIKMLRGYEDGFASFWG